MEGKQAAALKAYTRAEELLEATGRISRDAKDGRGVELTACVRVKTQVCALLDDTTVPILPLCLR